MGIVGDDDAGGRRAEPIDQPQRAVDILPHADGVGDHDVVERPFDRLQGRRILGIAEHEAEMRIARSGAIERPLSKVDADAMRRRERCQEFAGAAAKLEHALARRNQETHEFEIVGVIGLVDPAPALGLVEASLDVRPQLLLAGVCEWLC
jgi:hypothetical protein